MNQELSPFKQREHWVDSIKGFAILLVVLGHVVNGYTAAKQYTAYSLQLAFLHNSVYAFHMPLFFILSGYVVSLAYLTSHKHNNFCTKLADMTVLYLVWSILFGGMKIAASRFVSHEVSLTDILWIPLHAIDHFWYLYVLIFCYLLVYSLIRFQNHSKVLLLGGLAVSCPACFLFCLLPASSFTIYRLSGYFLFFLLGIALQQRNKMLIYWKKPLWIILHFVFSFLIVFFTGNRCQSSMAWKDYGLWGPVLAYCLSAAFIGLFVHLPPVPSLEFLGKHSLVIYILHNFCIAICRAVLPKIGIRNFVVSVFLSAVIAVALPVISVFIIQKMRIYQLLFSPVSFFAAKLSLRNTTK